MLVKFTSGLRAQALLECLKEGADVNPNSPSFEGSKPLFLKIDGAKIELGRRLGYRNSLAQRFHGEISSTDFGAKITGCFRPRSAFTAILVVLILAWLAGSIVHFFAVCQNGGLNPQDIVRLFVPLVFAGVMVFFKKNEARERNYLRDYLKACCGTTMNDVQVKRPDQL